MLQIIYVMNIGVFEDPRNWSGIDYEWLIGNGDESRRNAVVVEINKVLY
jgi:hypothetical protein